MGNINRCFLKCVCMLYVFSDFILHFIINEDLRSRNHLASGKSRGKLSTKSVKRVLLVPNSMKETEMSDGWTQKKIFYKLRTERENSLFTKKADIRQLQTSIILNARSNDFQPKIPRNYQSNVMVKLRSKVKNFISHAPFLIKLLTIK